MKPRRTVDNWNRDAFPGNPVLQRCLGEALERGLFLGGVYAVYRHPDGAVAAGVAGLAQENPPIPATYSTLWDLASLTKPIVTATSLLILAQEGRLHFDQTLQELLPDTGPALARITLRQLLTHTSGLKAWEKYHSQGLGREEVLRRVREAEPEREPGTGYAYSDLGYILLGEVVEAVTGQPLAEFARQRIFDPLGMTDTGFCPPPDRHDRLAATRCPDRGRVLVGEVHDGNCATMGGIAGHAGLFGTLPDLLRYAGMVLAGGECEGRRVLSPLAVREMGRNQNPPGLPGHALGWFTRPNGYLPAGDLLPPDTFGHTGFTGTSLLFSPSLGLAVVLLTNRVYRDQPPGPFLEFRRRFHNAVAGALA